MVEKDLQNGISFWVDQANELNREEIKLVAEFSKIYGHKYQSLSLVMAASTKWITELNRLI
ncbi:MAG: hypothetical protein CM15mV109_110 [uncultured marine virus]|nr:MAG: hypothetical protein CM15mV109_110 [uncultured marine virus]